MSDELKPCPFCGGREVFVDLKVGAVIRHQCDGRIDRPAIRVEGQTFAPTREAWNTRAALSALHGEEMREKIARQIAMEVSEIYNDDFDWPDDAVGDTADRARSRADSIMALIGGGGEHV